MKKLLAAIWLLLLVVAFADERVLGPVSLHQIEPDIEAGFRGPAGVGEFPFDPKNEKSPRIVISDQGRLEFKSSSGTMELSLLDDYYVDSVLWVSESRLLLTIWKTNGGGSSANCLIEFSADEDIVCNIRQVRFEEKGLVVLRVNGKNDKFVLADVRLGENKFEYFHAFLDPSQLPLIPKTQTGGPLKP